MKRFFLLIVVCSLSLSDLDAAVVNGKVMFLTKRGQKPVVNETLVWLDALGRAPKRPASAFTMTTRSKTFLPHVLAVPAGSTVNFPNEDPISHNLFSLTPGNTFDLGLYRKGPGKPHKFVAPGVVNVYCNIHPNMSAVVHVMGTPYYGFADANGDYSFDVPPGKYRVTAWNEQGGSATMDIDVAGAEKATGLPLLTIDGRNARAVQHKNKFGQAYKAPKDY
ncbi:MAG: methylamine utilization protein [Acidobacteriota bacterium]|nr:methylamine utilization protein [Acidobacteriota bacterium]